MSVQSNIESVIKSFLILAKFSNTISLVSLTCLFDFCRQSNLQSAEHLYRFQTDVSSLSSWVGKAREKLASIEESRNVKETKAMLNMHHQIKSELKIRREVFDRVKQYGETLVKEGGLRPDEVYPKLQQLDEEKTNLEKLLQEKNISLTHSFDMQVVPLLFTNDKL